MNSKLYFRRLEELAVFGLWRDCKNIYISSGFLLRFGILSNAKFLPKIRLICQLKTNLKNQGQIRFSWFETISIKMSHLWISVEANFTFVFLSSPLLSFLMTGNHSYWGNLRHCHLTFLYLYWLCNSPYPRIPIEANTITWLKFVWRWQLPRIAPGNDTLFLPRFASAWICIWISFASYCSAMTTKPFAASIWFRCERFFMTCIEIRRPFQYVSWSTNDQHWWTMINEWWTIPIPEMMRDGSTLMCEETIF